MLDAIIQFVTRHPEMTILAMAYTLITVVLGSMVYHGVKSGSDVELYPEDQE